MVRLKKMQYFLILIFPLFIILSATLLKGDGMNTISFLYTVIIWWLIIINHKNRIKMFDLFYLFFGIWLVLFSVLRETSATYYFGIQFANLIVAFILFSDRYFSINAFGLYCLKKQKIFKIVNIGIYALLMYSFLVNGLYYTKLWATGVFRGPFNLPHTLAYILFFITLLDLYYYDKLKGIIYLIFAGINTVLILSTAVRSVLLPLAFAFLYFILKIYRGNSNIKKLIISVTIIAGAIIIFWSGIALPVIEKSRFAFERGGDITNSRGKIFISSMKAIFDNKYDAEFNPVMGIGMSGLFEYNLKTLHFAIHAHNDLIDAFVCYGIIAIVVYIGSFWEFINKNKKWEGIIVLAIAIFNGLFPYGEVIPILILCRLFFETDFELKEEGIT